MTRSRAEEECETLGEAYNEGYEQGYDKGATEMERAKQIIIDKLLKQIDEIKVETIDECFKTIQNYFIEYCDNASNKECDLLCEVAKGIHERFEKLKEQKNE